MSVERRTIRPLGADDVATVQALDEIAHGSAWSHATYQSEIEGHDRLHLVAEVDAAIIGHAAMWFDGPIARVTNVAVSHDETGAGHASALLLRLIDAGLATARVRSIQLEVRPTNRRAQRLYGRFGFVPVGVERDFYDHSDSQGNRDALIMVVPDVHSSTWRLRIDELTARTLDPWAAA